MQSQRTAGIKNHEIASQNFRSMGAVLESFKTTEGGMLVTRKKTSTLGGKRPLYSFAILAILECRKGMLLGPVACFGVRFPVDGVGEVSLVRCFVGQVVEAFFHSNQCVDRSSGHKKPCVCKTDLSLRAFLTDVLHSPPFLSSAKQRPRIAQARLSVPISLT